MKYIRSEKGELIFSDDIERIHSLTYFLEEFNQRIKFLEDNAFADRAKIMKLEDEMELMIDKLKSKE